jgi:hypothetical protein
LAILMAGAIMLKIPASRATSRSATRSASWSDVDCRSGRLRRLRSSEHLLAQPGHRDHPFRADPDGRNPPDPDLGADRPRVAAAVDRRGLGDAGEVLAIQVVKRVIACPPSR